MSTTKGGPDRIRTPFAVPPGDTVDERLRLRNMSQSELARRMDRPIKTINEIVNGKAAITPATAIQLDHALGVSARFWNALEATYHYSLAHQAALQSLEEETSWAAKFPLRDMARHDL